jgi:hypothetical protein
MKTFRNALVSIFKDNNNLCSRCQTNKAEVKIKNHLLCISCISQIGNNSKLKGTKIKNE